MKKLIGSTLLLLWATAHAQIPDMSEQDMANVMGMFEELSACIGQLDEQRLDALGKRAEASGLEIEKLCEAGKRDEAQSKATNHAKEFMTDPEYKKVMQCGEAAQGMLPDLADIYDPDSEDEGEHVCDAF